MKLALEINSDIGSSRYVGEVDSGYISTFHRGSNVPHVSDQAAVVPSQALVPRNNIFVGMLQLRT